MRRFGWVILMGAALAGGCATRPPTSQVRDVVGAYQGVKAASDPLFDELAVAERAQGAALADDRAVESGLYIGEEGQGFAATIAAEDAVYFATLADPPGTQALRSGVAAVGSYASLLSMLAEGGNLEAARAQIAQLGGNLAAVGALVGGNAQLTGLVGPVIGALQPVIDQLGKAKNEEELRQLVLDNAPKVEALLDGLRKAAPPMYETLIAVARETYSLNASSNPAVARAAVVQIEGYRILVANYVVLLDRLGVAFERLLVAVRNPDNRVTLAVAAELSTDVAAQADAARRALAIVRAGGVPPAAPAAHP